MNERTIKVIKTEEDYEKALSRIDELMDAKAGTEEMDELEVLLALVEIYEDKHYPIGLPDPVEAIKFRMEQLGLTQKDMVPYFGTKSKVSEVLSGKRQLTLAMMRSLNRNLGIPAEVLLKESGATFPDDMKDWEWPKFPAFEMVKRGWVRKVDDIKGNTEELVSELIASAGGPKAASAALFRQGKSSRYNSKMDQYSLTAWCLRVLAFAKDEHLQGEYSKGSIKSSVFREIARLSYFENGPLLAREYLNKQGIHLVVVQHLPKTYLDGAAMLQTDGTPVIGLTLRHDRIDNFWFCLLHELAHVAKHLSAKSRIIVDDLDLRGQNPEAEDEIEKEADLMARNGLIPDSEWKKNPLHGKVTVENVRALAEKLKIHPAIIAGRVRFESNNYRLLSGLIGINQVRKHFQESFSGQSGN